MLGSAASFSLGAFDDLDVNDLGIRLLHSYPSSRRVRSLSARGEFPGRRVDQRVHSNLNGPVDLFADLLFPFSTTASGYPAPGSGAETLPVGH